MYGTVWVGFPTLPIILTSPHTKHKLTLLYSLTDAVFSSGERSKTIVRPQRQDVIVEDSRVQ